MRCASALEVLVDVMMTRPPVMALSTLRLQHTARTFNYLGASD